MKARRLRTILRLLPLLFVCFACGSLSAWTQSATAVHATGGTAPTAITLPGLGAADATVGGAWQFHVGDDLAWASPTLDDSGWQPISVAKSWGAQTEFPNHFNYIGMAWYRRHLEIPVVAGAPPDLALYLPRVDDAYEVYWNGALVGSFGRLPPHPVALSNPPPHTFGLGTARSGVLAIRVWKAPPESFSTGEDGGLTEPPRVGSPASIASIKGSSDYDWLRSREVTFGLVLLYALVAVLGFLIWLNDRSQRVLLWTALFAVAPVCQVLLLTLRTGMPYTLALGMMQPFIALPDVSLWFLLLYLFDLEKNRRLRRWTYILAWTEIIVQTLEGLIAAFQYDYPRPMAVVDAILTAIFTPLTLFALVLVGYILAHPKRLNYFRWMVATFALLSELVTTFRIAVSQGGRYTHWKIAEKISQPLFVLHSNPIGLRTLFSTGLLISIVYAVYRYQAEHRERQVAVEREFLSAQELQRVLIPEALPTVPGYAITSSYIPAQQVGGDFFQVIPLADGAALLMIGDVSGKGLKAAMTVSLIIGTTRTLAEFLTDPAELLAGLNRRLHGRLSGGFVTCLMLRIEADGVCQMAAAGHLPPVLNGAELTLPPALPLGIVADASYEPVDLRLADGDRLTLYTDGLLEARDEHGELFGFDRVTATAAAQATASGTVEAAGAFLLDDDITVMTITRIAAGVEATSSYAAPALVEV